MIGVVDVIKAVEQYPRYIELRNGLTERVRAYQENLKQLAMQLDELRATIPVIENLDDRAEKEFELQMGLQRQDFLRKMFQDRMQMEDMRNTLIVYEDLEVAIRKVAKARGATIVLTKQDIDPSPIAIADMVGREVEQRVKAYDRRNVWYYVDEIDLTGDVIKFLMVPLEKPAVGPKASDAKADGSDGGKE